MTPMSQPIELNCCEAYNEVINRTLVVSPDRAAQVWLLASARNGDGKTTTALGLALALASRNRKVLLIDANLSNPQLHQRLSTENTTGFSELLRDGLDLNTVVRFFRKSGSDGAPLGVVTSGQIDSDPMDLYASERLSEVLRQAKRSFDVTIIDTPAAQRSSDLLLLAPHVDGVLLVVSATRSTRTAVVELKRSIIANKGIVLGVIVNRATQPIPQVVRRLFFGE